MVVYAKSSPPEDLKTHTENLLREFETLKSLYDKRIERCVPRNFIEHFWDALELAIKYHDLGKLHTPFQNKIRERLEIPLIPTTVQEVPHNLLSPAFLNEEVLKSFPDELHTVIYQSIAYHHDKDRERELVENPKKWDIIEKIVNDDLLPNLSNLSDMKTLGYLPNTLKKMYRKRIINRFKRTDGDVYKIYVLLKGLLHRIDHAASAHLNVEENLLADSHESVVPYLLNKGVKQENIWQIDDAISHRDKNIVMRASTGIGKTEFAYLWLGKDKGFYTLPVRTSVNAMFERTKETFKNEESIGLLHSDSHFYQLEDALEKQAERSDSNSEGITKSLHLMDISRQFAMPITISTADQLFTAAFKYRGYEKIYATLSYSKVIIDEIQSYDPEIVAVIIKGLQEIVALGGRFCLMTATLPPLYKEHLIKLPNTEYFERISPDRKHRLKLIENDITEKIELIIEAFKHGKVLVIVNTVKKAQQVFEEVKRYIELKKLSVPIHLLHSAFTYGDRREKEKDILDENCNGIWITTQLVEASLDIDFPVLFTELATIDSLIQRMGRVLRRCKGENGKPFLYKEESPNVYIFKNASGIGYVYDKEIVSASLNHLHNFNEKLFGEEDKQSVVEKIFSRENLKGTKYLKKFDNSIRFLENGLEADDKRDAQELFRKISNMTVIPVTVYEKFTEDIDGAINLLDKINTKKEDRIRALYTIRKHSLSIPVYKAKNGISHLKKDVFLCAYKYTPEIGLIPSQDVENFL